MDELLKHPTITLKLVPADPNHYAAETGQGLRHGVMFFLRRESGEFDTKPYYTGSHTNINDFRRWFRAKMVYEPVSLHDEVEINYPEQEEENNP